MPPDDAKDAWTSEAVAPPEEATPRTLTEAWAVCGADIYVLTTEREDADATAERWRANGHPAPASNALPTVIIAMPWRTANIDPAMAMPLARR